MAKLMTPDLTMRGNAGARTARVLVDTGASVSFVRRDVAAALESIAMLPQPIRITLGDGRMIELAETAVLSLSIAGQAVTDNFIVMADLVEEAVLGAGTMRKYGLKLDMETSAIFAAIAEGAALAEASDIRTDTKKTEPSLSLTIEKETLMHEHLKSLCVQLGIATPDGMTDEQAMAAIVAQKSATAGLASSAVAAPAVLAALGVAADATVEQVQGKILALTHRADVVPVADLNALKAQLHERDKKDAIESAIQSGKLLPAEKDVWRAKLDSGDISLAAFNAFISERPKLSPLGAEKPKTEEQTGKGAAVHIDEEQRKINRQLGITDEMFLKYSV